MKLDELVRALDAEKYATLQTAVELGKWPDGRKLSTEEKSHALQVLIAYDAEHKPEEERIGYLHKPDKKDCHDEKIDLIEDQKDLIVKN